MRLKKYTDYALRVLIYTASKPEGELASIKEISRVFDISENHLGKIVHQLNKLELIETIRGRLGGLRLAKNPEEINIGSVVRTMEDDFLLLECFDRENNECVITPGCKLKDVLNDALKAFLNVLDHYTLADLLENQGVLKHLMSIAD
ncbi:Rrf2 family transcriptional regulator [Thalassobacillus pellis]|uniref:Rrf2 family transcriptional regulator n=1 Tax=Thalassobacillus pellis TaxID=748008 RepID=UPI001960F731|nr:Rrf2 family transcriptional regulator [Thalassobacillus pellis]MBM7552256.1 Rrf2 family nitric oxide-sensitive transcriptional repressor [Thalassobacillus pellis]